MEETLGKRIVHHRKRLKMTQDQLAEKLGVTAQAISKWENDQSCPDISLLPRLAELFGITTDALLGKDSCQPVYQGEVIDSDGRKDTNGSHYRKSFTWNSGKRGSIGFALWVLSVGVLYLLSHIFSWKLSLWDVLWPSALVIFGIWGFLASFSFFPLGCLLFGGYVLISKIGIFTLDFNKSMIWAVLIILLGGTLLVDAIKKPRKKNIKIHRKNGKKKSDYHCDDHSFSYRARFGETIVPVCVPNLKSGDIQVDFGEYTVDLTKAHVIAADCHIDAACTFGELRLLIPKSCKLTPITSTSFAEFEIVGVPNETCTSEITLDARVSFGEITIQYV